MNTAPGYEGLLQEAQCTGAHQEGSQVDCRKGST